MTSAERRPGLARQRTALSWQRTAIGAGLLGAAVLKLGISRGQVLEWIAAGWLLVVAGLLAAIAWRRQHAPGPPPVATRRWQLRAVTGAVLVATALVIAAVIDARP